MSRVRVKNDGRESSFVCAVFSSFMLSQPFLQCFFAMRPGVMLYGERHRCIQLFDCTHVSYVSSLGIVEPNLTQVGY